MSRMKNIFKLPLEKRNHSFIHNIGVLLRPEGTISFDKNGYCIVIEHQKEREAFGLNAIPHYILYSQNQERYWEVPCWVVNAFFVKMGV